MKDKLEKFAGCWKLVSYEFRTADGKLLHPFGPDPVGISINDGKGHFSAQIMRRDRPRFGGVPTYEQLQAIFGGYIAYFGTTEVDEEKGIRINHVEGSLNPNWVGGDQIRFYELDGDRITFKTPPMKVGDIQVTGVLVWERIRG